MLPFLKSKDVKSSPGVIVEQRKPDYPDDPAAPIDSCAQELIRAVHAKDVKAVAAAMQDAFEILGSQPEEFEPAEEIV